MKKDPGPTPIPASHRIKDKPVYEDNPTDRAKERKKRWSIEQLRNTFGYAIDDEIDWDSVDDVVSFVPVEISAEEKTSIIPNLVHAQTSTPEEIEERKRQYMESGLLYKNQLSDVPLPVVPQQ